MSIHVAEGEAKRSTNSEVVGPWPPESTGEGVSAVGSVVEVRNHSVAVKDATGGGKEHKRFVAVRVKVSSVRNRVFDPSGTEIDTHSRGERVLRRGYLSTERVTETDYEAISSHDWVARLGGAAVPRAWFGDLDTANVHPAQEDVLEFWGEANYMRSVDLKKGDDIKLKTKGASVLIESVARETELATHFHGEEVGGGWTAKISQGQGASAADDKPLPGDDLEGADDDEWDD